jgi:hypothetical protein
MKAQPFWMRKKIRRKYETRMEDGESGESDL